MKVSVNILCWNNKRCLVETLKVLQIELGHMEYEVVVVDNGSDDGTKDIVMSDYCDNVIYIRNSVNRGISHGKNQGIEASSGNYIMLLDGDIIPIPGSIRKFIEYLDDNEKVDAIGFYPNKYSSQMNKGGQLHHEEICEKLHDPRPHHSHCIFYGLYRSYIFDEIMFCTEGAFGHVGYGWEDFDFYNQMVEKGYSQWVTHINRAGGKYFHDINSSIKVMGKMKFRETSVARKELYDRRWPNA